MTQTPGTRSWWGWGTEEEALGAQEAAALVARLAGLLPDADLTVHAPPALRPESLPAVRITPPPSLAPLSSTDTHDRAGHTHGKAFRDIVRNLRGDLAHAPDLVVRPRTERDVVDVLDWASSENVAVIPYGGGTSVVGGVEARLDGGYAGALSLDVTAMDRVLEVDRTSRAARIQAGVLGPHLEEQLRPYDLTLRHFPQSFAFSTLGGWLATRAGGHFATLYTHIDDLTESLRVVSPYGVGESRRLPGSGAGPSPDRMFLGSEGALGVITEAWMRLQDRPRWRAGDLRTLRRLGRGRRGDPGGGAVRALPVELPSPRRCGGVPQHRRERRRGRARARLRVGRPSRRRRPRTRRRPVPRPRRDAPRGRREGHERRSVTRRRPRGAPRSCGCRTSATPWSSAP